MYIRQHNGDSVYTPATIEALAMRVPDLAAQLGVSRWTLWRWITGRNKPNRRDMLAMEAINNSKEL